MPSTLSRCPLTVDDSSLSPADRRDHRSLALRAGRGDNDAVTELIRATRPVVWRVCAALVDASAADDLTQDTFLRAVRSLRSYRGDSSPTRWLLTIARRVCADEIGKRQRSRALMASLAASSRLDVEDSTQLSDLSDAIARLPAARREAVLLTAVAGLSYQHAADLCQCPVGTIRSRVSRAKTELSSAISLDSETDIEQQRSA